MKKLDKETVLEIIKMVDEHSDDIRAMINETRPWELRDSQWIFKDEKVGYGAEMALRHLTYMLIDSIDMTVQEVYNNETEQ